MKIEGERERERERERQKKKKENILFSIKLWFRYGRRIYEFVWIVIDYNQIRIEYIHSILILFDLLPYLFVVSLHPYK
jgi:hypothetical protein